MAPGKIASFVELIVTYPPPSFLPELGLIENCVSAKSAPITIAPAIPLDSSSSTTLMLCSPVARGKSSMLPAGSLNIFSSTLSALISYESTKTFIF